MILLISRSPDFLCLYPQKTLILSQPQGFCFPRGEFAPPWGDSKWFFSPKFSADGEEWRCERHKILELETPLSNPSPPELRQILPSPFLSPKFRAQQLPGDNFCWFSRGAGGWGKPRRRFSSSLFWTPRCQLSFVPAPLLPRLGWGCALAALPWILQLQRGAAPCPPSAQPAPSSLSAWHRAGDWHCQPRDLGRTNCSCSCPGSSHLNVWPRSFWGFKCFKSSSFWGVVLTGSSGLVCHPHPPAFPSAFQIYKSNNPKYPK